MILTITVRQLARTWRVWVGVFAVAVVATALCCASSLQVSTARLLSTLEERAILSLAYGQAAFVIIAALIATDNAARFALSATRLDLARLQLAGMTPRGVAVMAVFQVCCTSAVGSVAGAFAGVGAAQPMLDWTVSSTSIRRSVPVVLDFGTVFMSAGTVIAVMVIGAMRAAVICGRVPAVQGVRGSGSPRFRFLTVARMIMGVLTLGAVIALTAGLRSVDIGGGRVLDANAVSLVVGLGVLLIFASLGLIVALAPALVPACAAWTSTIPASWSLSWHLARSALRRGDGRATAEVVPVVATVVLPGALMTIFLTTGAAIKGGMSTDVNIGGLAILVAPALGVTTIGAAMIVLMSGAAQRGRVALVEALGASAGVSARIALAEATIVVVTATGIALVIVFVVGAAVGAAVGVAPVVGYAAIGLAAGAAWVLVTAITVLPVMLSRPRGLADSLRAIE